MSYSKLFQKLMEARDDRRTIRYMRGVDSKFCSGSKFISKIRRSRERSVPEQIEYLRSRLRCKRVPI